MKKCNGLAAATGIMVLSGLALLVSGAFVYALTENGILSVVLGAVGYGLFCAGLIVSVLAPRNIIKAAAESTSEDTQQGQ